MMIIYKKAMDLPEEWDIAAGENFSLYKRNLLYLEKVNPCDQTYLVFRNNDEVSILVHYKLKLNVLCYSGFKLKLAVTVIGIPCSVSEPGFSIHKDRLHEFSQEFSQYIKSLRGFTIMLNAPSKLNLDSFSYGDTLPTCILDIKWNSFEDYIADLRSHYRYRFRKAIKKMDTFTIRHLKGDFSNKHYQLYQQVYNKSEYKLEKLGIAYFQNSEEAGASLIEFIKDGEPAALLQYAINRRKMYFLFGGLDYSLNKDHDLYQNMLLYLVQIAIDNHCTHLNLGQTAEEMKCRLGAHQEGRHLYVHHSNRLMNRMVKGLLPFFSYPIKELDFNVFKVKTANGGAKI